MITEDSDLLSRHLERERAARKAAETLLEKKSLELYDINRNLHALNLQLEEDEARYRKLVELMPDAILVHTGGKIVFLNTAAVRLFGASSAQELLGSSISDRAPAEYRHLLNGQGHDAVKGVQEATLVTIQVQRLDGSRVDVEFIDFAIQFQNAPSIMAVAHDITERRQHEAAEHQATHDQLTGLPNRILFRDRLTHAIRFAERHEGTLAVMFVDLDRFKYINDTFGHGAGDQLLCIVAARLKECVRESDTVARLGGDEFLVLLDNPGTTLTAQIAQRVINRLAAPMTLAGQDHVVTCSVGISLYPEDDRHPEALLQQADIAMYRAKEGGRNVFRFFTREMQSCLDARNRLQQALYLALQHDEFLLHYQPQVDLRSGSIIGLEALIRWQSPEFGLVMPADFIPFAEESNQIFAIGEWVLHAVCSRIKAWQDSGLPIVPVAINVAASQFAHQRIDQLAQQALQAWGVEAKYLELELTESLSMDDPDTSIALMHRLKETGVALTIDDFGTGYSNLSYLKRFPVDKLKIDQSFIRGMTHDPEDRSIITAVIQLAHSLGLRVIAEGVETEGQMRLLAAEDCDEIQGYYFSRPLPEAEITTMLEQQPRLDLTNIERTPSRHTLLLVDNEPQLLAGFRQLLNGHAIELLTAEKPEEAYEILARQEVSVAISAQQLCNEDGSDFLARVKRLYPHTVCIPLTDHNHPAISPGMTNPVETCKFIATPLNTPQVLATLSDAFRHHER